MTQLRIFRVPSCSCGTCGPSSVGPSRRQFLCTTPAGSLAAVDCAEPYGVSCAGSNRRRRPVLIYVQGGYVLSLDRAVGDFEAADVLVRGKTFRIRPKSRRRTPR